MLVAYKKTAVKLREDNGDFFVFFSSVMITLNDFKLQITPGTQIFEAKSLFLDGRAKC